MSDIEAELGAVYMPLGNPGYAYVLVRLTEDTVTCLQLWSNHLASRPGEVWEMTRKWFERDLRARRVVRFEQRLKRIRKRFGFGSKRVRGPFG